MYTISLLWLFLLKFESKIFSIVWEINHRFYISFWIQLSAIVDVRWILTFCQLLSSQKNNRIEKMEKPLRKFIYFPLLLLIIFLVEKSKAGSSEKDFKKGFILHYILNKSMNCPYNDFTNIDFKSLVLNEIELLKKGNRNQNLRI